MYMIANHRIGVQIPFWPIKVKLGIAKSGKA